MLSKGYRLALLSISGVLLTTYILLPSQASYLGVGEQHPFSITGNGAKQVAVIGAGAAGSSAAYYLRDLAEKQDLPLNITVYERNNYVGGRVHTVNAYDDPNEPVELGASIFVQVNKNLFDATKLFDLPTTGLEYGGGDGAADIGVWDGTEFRLVISDGWWSTVKMLWRYGLSPIRTKNLVSKVVGQFLKMYEEPVFPWKSLTQTALDLELVSATSNPGLQYLASNNILAPFTTDLIQASTRVNYASNLGHIHGLTTMVSMSTDNAMAIKGGNWQIFDRMLLSSRASVLLETAVTSVERVNGKKTWVVTAKTSNGQITKTEYDEVIIAGPYQYSNITSKSIKAPETIKYVDEHVTLFASPHRLSPKYFKYDQPMVPDMILTTLPKDYDAESSNVGPAGFWSANILRTTERDIGDGVKRKEYIYKIFAPKFFTNEEILEMMDLPADSDGLTWTYRKLWQSYPVAEPRSSFQEQQLDFGLWYTSGMEAFISCMETMTLSGKNVAANIVEKWAAEQSSTETPAVQPDRSL